VAANAVPINNGIPQGILGHWSVEVLGGGESATALLTAEGLSSGATVTDNVLFAYLSIVDQGNGQPFSLASTLRSGPAPDPNDPNGVISSGSFNGPNDTIVWTARSSIAPGSQVLTTVFEFRTLLGTLPLGTLRFLQYLDEDAITIRDNIFFPFGSAGNGDLQLFTVDNTEVFGVSQSGAFIPGLGL
jgi:hypothetical protein